MHTGKKLRVMPSTKSKRQAAKGKEVKREMAATYNEFKDFEGQMYTGMKIGRSHKWYYDKGEWKETKITPDLWQINYAVIKRRAGKAPEGSGVPVGTEYHWYIMAHQNVRKLDANNYTTSLTGLKYKVAHKRADKDKWSVTEKTQRKRLIKFLQGMIKELEAQNGLGGEGGKGGKGGTKEGKRIREAGEKRGKRDTSAKKEIKGIGGSKQTKDITRISEKKQQRGARKKSETGGKRRIRNRRKKPALEA
jgi:hypothetical protein